ncbi:MAG: hypothetical protein ACRCY9_20545, partial [Phycicoccus sp.]
VIPVGGPATPEEMAEAGATSVTPMPRTVIHKVRLGMAAPVGRLVDEGVVPSAEVLAELVPALTARQVGTSVDDPALGDVLAATYTAFRRRRTLLLLDLAKQVRFTELPWVHAASGASVSGERPDDPASVARHVAAIALDAFPGTLLPNPLISELSTLYAAAGVGIPLTEELAADIFMGRFSPKFRAAARLAAERLQGSLYERYYGLDYAEVVALAETWTRPPKRRWFRRPPVADDLVSFDELCSRSAPPGDCWSVARNGMIIERQQLLTTHNLAALVYVGGVRPTSGWDALALSAAGRCARLVDLAQTQDRPLATVKDAAYAWRHAMFFGSMLTVPEQADVVAAMRRMPSAEQWPMTEIIDGLSRCIGHEDRDLARPFVGWTATVHWVLDRRKDRRADRRPVAGDTAT